MVQTSLPSIVQHYYLSKPQITLHKVPFARININHCYPIIIFLQFFMDYNHFIKQRMNLLELSSHQAYPEPMLEDLLRVVFEGQGLQAYFSSNNGKSSQQVQYLTNLYLPRAQTHINAIWQYKTSSSIVLISLTLNTHASALTHSLPEFLMNRAEQIQEWVYLLNNLKLCDSPAYFVFKQHTGQIQLRYKTNKFRFLRSSQSMLRYFNRCVALVAKRFIEQIENLIFYYRLPGFSMLELEAQMQMHNFVPLGQETQNIMLLRQCFEADRRRRANQIMEEVYYNAQVAKAANLLLTGCTEWRARQMTKTQQQLRIHSTQEMCRFQLSKLLSDISHKPQGAQSILTSIIIKEKSRENMIGAGGYAQIFHGIYSYVLEMSIYNLCTRPEIVIINDEAMMKNCSLVKKVGLQGEEGTNVPLQNQCSFLKYMRNKVCPYFAKYYCNSNKLGPFANGQIYLQYYPFNLGECRLREDRKMKVMEDVILALLFLNEEKIIHRDLKEVNIMIDRYYRGRLIDFGSVTSINGYQNFQARDEKVRSTAGYYIPYRQAVRMHPKIEERISQHDYYSHQTYDLYGFGKILQKEFSLATFTEQSHFVRHNLRFLSEKCQEVNPQDRWTVPQVAIFLRHLLLFQELRKEFWKRGFDPRFRAHLLGTYYRGQGEYEQSEKLNKAGFTACLM